MPISELGYRHWQGKRTGATRRWLAITRSEVAIAYRSSKLLRRFLFFAWMPILYYCPFFLAVGYVADPANDLDGSFLAGIAGQFLPREAIEQLRANPEQLLPGIWAIAFYFFFAYTQSVLSMIAIAIVGPQLISKDIKSKAFLVYFSKPIQGWQYLLGKLGTVVFFVFTLTLFPALFLYVIGIALSPDTSTLLAVLPIIPQIVASSLMVAVPTGLVVLLLSSLTSNRRIATFAWVAVWIFGEISFRVLTIGGNFSADFKPPPWAGFLSLRELTTRATSGIFNVRTNLQVLIDRFSDPSGRMQGIIGDIASDMGDIHFDRPRGQIDILDIAGTGYDPSVSIAVLIGLSICAAVIVVRRVTKPVRI